MQRPGQPTRLPADPRKAREKLGWTAHTTFEALVPSDGGGGARVGAIPPLTGPVAR